MVRWRIYSPRGTMSRDRRGQLVRHHQVCSWSWLWRRGAGYRRPHCSGRSVGPPHALVGSWHGLILMDWALGNRASLSAVAVCYVASADGSPGFGSDHGLRNSRSGWIARWMVCNFPVTSRELSGGFDSSACHRWRIWMRWSLSEASRSEPPARRRPCLRGYYRSGEKGSAHRGGFQSRGKAGVPDGGIVEWLEQGLNHPVQFVRPNFLFRRIVFEFRPRLLPPRTSF